MIKLVTQVGIFCFLSWGLISIAMAGKAACKDYFSTCTEGGCAQFNVTTECKLWCVDNATEREIKVDCYETGSLGGNPDPANQAPSP